MPRKPATDPLEQVQAKLRAFDRIVDIVKGLQPRRVRMPKPAEPDEPPQGRVTKLRGRKRASSADDMPPLDEE